MVWTASEWTTDPRDGWHLGDGTLFNTGMLFIEASIRERGTFGLKTCVILKTNHRYVASYELGRLQIM